MFNLFVLPPDVIAGQVDVLPAQRREVWQQRPRRRPARVPQRLHRALQIDRVPEHDGGDHQVQAAGAVALVLEAPVAQLAQPVEEHRPCQRVLGLALVQPDLHAAAQLDALQPVEREQRALDAPQLAQRHRQAVLTRIAAELAQHQRGGHRALLDRRGQPQDLVPVGADLLEVDVPPISGASAGYALASPGTYSCLSRQVADARREAEAQQVHQGEDVVGEAGRVGVVLLDPQVGLVVEQPVEHVGGVAHRDVDDLGVERRVLVGDVGVERARRARCRTSALTCAGALGRGRRP